MYSTINYFNLKTKIKIGKDITFLREGFNYFKFLIAKSQISNVKVEILLY